MYNTQTVWFGSCTVLFIYSLYVIFLQKNVLKHFETDQLILATNMMR